MINYNPKDWFFFLVRFPKADTFRKLFPLMILVSLYSCLIAYFELNHLNLTETNHIRNVGLMHGVLGFVISLLLVFRTNTAYDRWWEGRRIWGGLTNSSRNLAIMLQACLEEEDDRVFFRRTIPGYAFALKSLLRENEDFHEIDPVLDLKKERHLPNQIAASMYQKITRLHMQGKLSATQLLALDAEVRALTNHCGACERIKNTPIPFTYSVFIKKFIFFFVMTLPFGWVFSMGYFVVPVVVLILYALASLELIAEEIENPFGTDANDLPLDQICQNIRKHVGELLSEPYTTAVPAVTPA
ncbi:bestrophin family protein [Pontibacter beigongshangensis]|uniref:bestrophin family protein n=1 Tax=Pontibacter beigongshangensis TaxID=2574733 RepID=UPI00164F20EC|nr:bestrophin family ion channel [Pontibacter beigongshangensis]